MNIGKIIVTFNDLEKGQNTKEKTASPDSKTPTGACPEHGKASQVIINEILNMILSMYENVI